MALFRKKMVAAIGSDSKLQGCAVIGQPCELCQLHCCRTLHCCLLPLLALTGQQVHATNQCKGTTPHAPTLLAPSCRYDAIVDLTRRLNSQFATARETQVVTRGILNSLFPSWLPGAFKVGQGPLQVADA